MAYNGIQQVVIDSSTNIAKRAGFCDMENDGSFNSDTETMVEKNFAFNPSIDSVEWIWDGDTFNQGGAISEEHNSIIQHVDVNGSSRFSFYRTMSRIIYMGTANMGPIQKIELISYMDFGITSYSIRIVDKGNQSVVIAEVTGLTNTDDTIIDIGNISNLPSSQSRFDIQVRKTGGSWRKEVYLDSVMITY